MPNSSGTPAAEIKVDATLARQLLRDQRPEFSAFEITPAPSGWDNAIFRLGDELALRLPRRQIAVELLQNEQRWLPLLSAHLPLRTPVPLWNGRPQKNYPWPWSIIPWIEGETADLAQPGLDQGEVLASFFTALHKPAPADAPVNPWRGVPLANRLPKFESAIANLRGRTELIDDKILAIWRDALGAPNDARPTWIHGDPHPRNVLVSDSQITAVIDWGDMAQGDRASDLGAIWMLLPDRAARQRAISACTDVSPATWRRARGWAVLYGAILLDAGLVDDARMAIIARRTFARLVEGP